MKAEAFRDKVAVIGMGCTQFGALQDMSFAEQGLEAVPLLVVPVLLE